MKLIIDIPEVVKHKVYAYGLSLSPSDKEQLINAIMNGIPLDKLRAELHETAEMHDDGDYYLRDEWIDEYFDEYRNEVNE